jgi:hypothetical protein
VSGYEFVADLWRSTGQAAWYFVTLPHDVADEIDEITAESRRGFGSVRVRATVGATTWDTSIFPDTKTQSYVLPIKQSVRSGEGLDDGLPIAVHLTLVDTCSDP